MIPSENRIFLVIALLLVFILSGGYLIFGDEDESFKLPAHPIEELKNRMNNDAQ